VSEARKRGPWNGIWGSGDGSRSVHCVVHHRQQKILSPSLLVEMEAQRLSAHLQGRVQTAGMFHSTNLAGWVGKLRSSATCAKR
jgi:hypothetical protein